MTGKEPIRGSEERQSERRPVRLWSRLQMRVTISFVAVAVVTVLFLELIVAAGAFIYTSTNASFIRGTFVDAAKQAAHTYGLEAGGLAAGGNLDPRTTFAPGQPYSLYLPEGNNQIVYHAERAGGPVAFALLIAPDGRVLASSYPALYPVSASAVQVLQGQAQPIMNALAGQAGSGIDADHAWAIEPVRGSGGRVIGASYVQVPVFSSGNILQFFPYIVLFSLLVLLCVAAPVGGFFGIVMMRGLVRRIHNLVLATAQFAKGDYSQRVRVAKQDEVGQLEQQFNSMAGQLVESIQQRQALAEQSARLEERARIEQEMRTAQYIQHAFLPKELPRLPGWQLAALYRPAREVGGDFYDFIPFADGRIGLVIGDVTDKGIPAALVMTTTRSMLRMVTHTTDAPGKVLEQVNELLSADLPARMFVTCFYAIFDPQSGRLRYANAGQDWPYCQGAGEVSPLRVNGMPLGMLPGTQYDEREVVLAPGESLLFFSDGLIEAHNPQGEMFGLPRLEGLLKAHPGGPGLIEYLLAELAAFTGPDWEQEDDVTLVVLERAPVPASHEQKQDGAPGQEDEWRLLGEWEIPSEFGNERLAMEHVSTAVRPFGFAGERLASLETAVAEATMNAMEHGNHYQPDQMVRLQVLASARAIAVRIRDQGSGGQQPINELEQPDLVAKLAEEQSPRGWGLFLIKNLVDDLHVTSAEDAHEVELIMRREEVGAGEQEKV